MPTVNPHQLWRPYAQMRRRPPDYRVDSARGARLRLEDGRELVDAIASWWCVIHGYNHPELNAALTAQLEKMAHVMLGGLTHQPAEELAARLIEITPAGLNHVFFSDSGSVGVEVALKMAAQYWRNLGHDGKTRFLALRQAYHGDTCAAMSVGDPEEGLHALFAGLLPRQDFLPAPCGGYGASAESVAADGERLRRHLEAHHETLAGFILEPLLQAAGGFNLYSPEYLKLARRWCDEYGVLLIFDEVATGFGRTGTLFAAEQAGVTPDLMVLGKGLTAGYLGHAATLATDRIYDAFLGDRPELAFMHGPTFMGNPLACAVALKSLEIFQRDGYLAKIRRIEKQLQAGLLPLTGPEILETRVLGATGVVEVKAPAVYAGMQEFAAERGVWLRPFGRYVYTMPPYVISEKELGRILAVIREWFANR